MKSVASVRNIVDDADKVIEKVCHNFEIAVSKTAAPPIGDVLPEATSRDDETNVDSRPLARE